MTTTEAALRDALIEVQRTLENPQPAIACTIWCANRPAETLLDFVTDALSQPSPASSTAREVMTLVIAAREAWEVDCVSGDDLDKALEPFAALVPYENEPDREAISPSSGEPASVAVEAECQDGECPTPSACGFHEQGLSKPTPVEDETLKRAQQIVAIANQHEGEGPEVLAIVPVGALRSAAMIVNGVAFAPLMEKMHWRTPVEAGLREAVMALPYDPNDDYAEVRRDERNRIIAALSENPPPPSQE